MHHKSSSDALQIGFPVLEKCHAFSLACRARRTAKTVVATNIKTAVKNCKAIQLDPFVTIHPSHHPIQTFIENHK